MKYHPEQIAGFDQSISELEKVVRMAPTLGREEKLRLYQGWKSIDYLQPVLDQDAELPPEPIKSAMQTLAVGVLGLGRSYYQDLISLFKPWKTLSKHKLDQQKRDATKAESFEESVLDFPLLSLPPITIDRQAIDWYGEINQLMAENMVLVGDYDRALEHIRLVESNLEKRLEQINPLLINWQIPDVKMELKTPSWYWQRQQFIGSSMARAKISIRRAQALRTYDAWQKAYSIIDDVQQWCPQPEIAREALFQSIKSAFEPDASYSRGEKWALFRRSPKMWFSQKFKDSSFEEVPT